MNVKFSIPANEVGRIATIQKGLAAKTTVEAISNALRLAEWYVNHVKLGHKVLLDEGAGPVEVRFNFKGLELMP